MISTPEGGCTLRSLGGDQQATDAVISEQLGIRSEAPVRIDDGPRRLGSGDLPDSQLRIVSNGRPDSHHDDVDQRTQPMKMFNAGWAIYVFRMTGCGRDPPVQRLTELTHDHQIIDGPLTQGTKQICPNLRKRLLSVTKRTDEIVPMIAW